MGTASPPPASAAVLPEGRARTVLRSHPGDGLEGWLAEQPWRALEDGSWRVEPEHDGRSFRVEGVSGRAVRVIAQVRSGPLTAWMVG
jgi:hypothetical protein